MKIVKYMRKFVNFAFVVMFFVSCSKDTNVTKQHYLSVTPNNISGVWSLESYDNGVALEDGSFLYIDFNRAERTFTSYDNLESMEMRKLSGRYDVVTDASAIIRGTYHYGRGDWEHDYYVRDLTSNRMVWVATDDENIVQVYVRAVLPEEWQSEE
jgi:hypothetical protein